MLFLRLFRLKFLQWHVDVLLSNRKSIAESFGYVRKHSSASLSSRSYFPFEQLDQSVIFW